MQMIYSQAYSRMGSNSRFCRKFYIASDYKLVYKSFALSVYKQL